MMFLAIVLVPVAGSIYAGGFDVILERVAATSPQLLDLVPDKGPAGIIAIISAIGWGLGYFGQPHILVRFMAIQDASELHKAKHIAMQHQPYLDNVVKKQGLKLVSIGKTIILPMAIYSHTYKNLNDIANGASVAIPNDPTNGARALLLLQQAKLITLKTGTSVDTAVTDITENPKHLKFLELDAAQIARSLDDADIACVNTNYAIPAGLNPQKDSLLVEDKNSPYANVMVVRAEDKDNPAYKKVLEIYQSEPIKKFILEHFQGTILPAF